MGKPIYYIEAKATFFKKKHPHTRDVWIVSTYDDPREIMRHDNITMSRLDKELLSPKAKERFIVIKDISSIKQMGTTCDVKEAQR